MKRRDLLKMAAAGAAAMAAPRIARAAAPLRYIPQADLAVLDPIWTTAQVTMFHSHLIFETLYALDGSYNVQPQMIEGHVVENDGKLWTLTLREGLRFHDNEPVRGRDVVASVKRWAARDSFGMTLMAVTDEISAPSDRTITFRLKKPFPMLPAALGKPGGYVPCIMPERLAVDSTKQITEMVGSGPYRFIANEWRAGSRVAYEKFANYVPRTGAPGFTAGAKVAHIDRIEWVIIPDPATAAAALQAGEVDWWENASADLLPLLKQQRNITVFPYKIPSTAIMRFNALHPPFDNPAIRRALLGAVDQGEFMNAAHGSDREYWRDGAGVFSSVSPLANDAGIDVLTSPRNLDKVREAIKAAGYRGERVVMLDPADYAVFHATSLVGAEMLRKVGMNVDVQTLDWGTTLLRRSKQEAPDKGGWNVYCTGLLGPNNFDPAGHLGLRGNGMGGWFGWPTIPRLEELREAWLDAPDLDAQKRVARDIQMEIWQSAPFLPLGESFAVGAHRNKLTNVPNTFPLFYNVRWA
ncbi:MAG TPA: ABC transporter substrate-binding protein [Xanthobacteraceae bacterium]|jgi:peptide/nickel transport system substrate-binding protein|nr:ABC transporter substrate-binding protein [Xanthobacteraceae bacterium]